MDGDGLPLSSLLPLSQPAVQAPIDIPDAPPSSESTGGDADVDMEESDSLLLGAGDMRLAHCALQQQAGSTAIAQREEECRRGPLTAI